MKEIRSRELIKKETRKRIFKRLESHPRAAVGLLTICVFLLIFSVAISISFGAADIDLRTVWQAFIHFDETDTNHLIIQDLRLPRVLAAAFVGSFLAVSGVIMQGLTQNPLASPSVMGVTSGSAFMIAIAFAFFPSTSHYGLIVWSFLGAGLGASLVFIIGSFAKRGLTPVKLALAGVAVSTLLQSLSTMIALHFNVARDISFWYAGGVAGVRWQSVEAAFWVAIIGFLGAFVLSRPLTVMSLGDEVAKGLGQRTALVKFFGAIVVLLLTGAAVSIAGTVGFIGLVIPHMTRKMIGIDYRWVMPVSAVMGALLLVLADIGARVVNPPFETPLGAITALIGVPFFLFLARREGRGW